MLRTRDRSLLLETLRPPAGYAIDRAIGTTYTLDLAALLAAPLAFTFFNYQDEGGEPTQDPVALLEALRRHAAKMTLFCQAGAISVPKPQLTLLAYLEDSIVQVEAPRGGIFHPKMWLLRFTAEGRPVRYRFLCLSRNLTFERAWDTCLSLEGELTDRKLGFGRNRPLGELVAMLPRLATGARNQALLRELRTISDEVRRTRFEAPQPFKEVFFHPLGLGKGMEWPFPKGARALAISPFLTPWAVEKLGREQALEVLVSRPESLEAVPVEALPEEETWVLSSGAQLDAQEISEEPAEESSVAAVDSMELSGLHAKVFLIERVRQGHLFVGSANATAAAFHQNVELLVELVGGRWRCGIDALLGDEDDAKQDSLRSLLQRYERPHQDDEEATDEVQERLERRVEELARSIAATRLSARVEEIESGGPYGLELRGTLPEWNGQISVSAWPATLSAEQRHALESRQGPSIARYESVSFEALTAFWAFETEARESDCSAELRFVVPVPLVNAPPDRMERLLRSFLKNRRQVLRLLLLLLSDDALDVSQLVDAGDDSEQSAWGRLSGWDEPTLLEALLQGLSRDPKRLDQVERLIRDLGRTPEGRDLLPEGLEEIWRPVWAAREGAAR